jgi:hypothetical protein
MAIFVTTFEKIGKWSQIGRKISSFQPIFKYNQPLLNLIKTSLIQAIFSFNFSIYSQLFIGRTAVGKQWIIVFYSRVTYKIKIPITHRVTGIYYLD